MKLIFGTLAAMVAELVERKVEAVRIAPLVQSERGRATGVPYHTSWIVVTAELGDHAWAECRLWVGRGMGEIADGGTRLPEAIRERGEKLLAEVRSRIEAEGLRVLDGMVAHDAEAVDGGLE
ncbi:MAG: hypothetical protein HY726_20650 [Candidatus Rokubacteria bacterium]|nr:hypothetical protein [Candidatus Rokubacteria bacterium]